MKRSLAGLALAAAALVGCAKPSVDATPLAELTTASLKDIGYALVVAQISARQAGLPLGPTAIKPADFQFTKAGKSTSDASLTLRATPEIFTARGETEQSELSAATLARTSVQLVKAGDYRLTGVLTPKHRWRGTPSNDIEAPAFGGFSVAPGDIAYLGDVQLWLNEPGDVPGLTRAQPRFSVTMDRAVARRMLAVISPSLARHLTARPLYLSARALNQN